MTCQQRVSCDKQTWLCNMLFLYSAHSFSSNPSCHVAIIVKCPVKSPETVTVAYKTTADLTSHDSCSRQKWWHNLQKKERNEPLSSVLKPDLSPCLAGGTATGFCPPPALGRLVPRERLFYSGRLRNSLPWQPRRSNHCQSQWYGEKESEGERDQSEHAEGRQKREREWKERAHAKRKW